MALSTRDHIFIKVVQVTHHQGDVRHCISTGIQCSSMSLDTVSWTLFTSPGLCDKYNLDYILGHLFPMHLSSTPWKHQKTVRFSDVFGEVGKGCIGNKWVTQMGLVI